MSIIKVLLAIVGSFFATYVFCIAFYAFAEAQFPPLNPMEWGKYARIAYASLGFVASILSVVEVLAITQKHK